MFFKKKSQSSMAELIATFGNVLPRQCANCRFVDPHVEHDDGWRDYRTDVLKLQNV